MSAVTEGAAQPEPFTVTESMVTVPVGGRGGGAAASSGHIQITAAAATQVARMPARCARAPRSRNGLTGSHARRSVGHGSVPSLHSRHHDRLRAEALAVAHLPLARLGARTPERPRAARGGHRRARVVAVRRAPRAPALDRAHAPGRGAGPV